ncbi:helix-turn-helix domain-containing protein [Xylocopilactobacillus apis]|uniref:HTH cro/C1-type domain-containing protein n=1 Tax=Xylocopilactobacillus apis TaxID=2932183 RepID=A0AAU9CZU5_9LACO|nr:helix-turn-helix transcriptional regulator [Xylocopilactobacillus apis]BDR55535.1 hypothetical protein KIMC2_00970 [Xylocopilactobacillus apis]
MKLTELESSFSSIQEDEKFIIDTMAELYSERIKKGISQKELSKRIGMPQPQLAKLEALDSLPTLKTLNRYAKGLGFELSIELISA